MIDIGGRTISGPLVLAPLAGYSDLPFRLLCRQFGASLAVSEMISCHGLVYGQAKTRAMLASCAEERPVSFQLFGADPQVMAEATAILAEHDPDFIDINMGCPVKKVTKRGAGAALMGDPRLAARITRSVVENSSCPVTVKFRSGPDSASICAVDFALMMEECGAAAVAVHGRTWKQAFSGLADWQVVADVVRRVSIPVFGNGDIETCDQAHQRMQQTGCSGVLIGRGAIGNPWVFSREGRPADSSAIIQIVLKHMDLVEHVNENQGKGLGNIKNHLGKYFRNIPGSAQFRKKVYEQPDWSSLRSFIQSCDSLHVTPA